MIVPGTLTDILHAISNSPGTKGDLLQCVVGRVACTTAPLSNKDLVTPEISLGRCPTIWAFDLHVLIANMSKVFSNS